MSSPGISILRSNFGYGILDVPNQATSGSMYLIRPPSPLLPLSSLFFSPPRTHCVFIPLLQLFLTYFELSVIFCSSIQAFASSPLFSELFVDIQQRIISLFDINMFSAKMQKLFVFVLLYGCITPLGFALPKNVIHGQHASGSTVSGHLKARASHVDYTEAYNQLMKLLHEIYGDDVGKVLQDPEWLTRVCSRVCAPDDQKCRQECAEKQSGYVSYPDFCFRFSFADELII